MIKEGKTYKIEGPEVALYGKVFQVNEPDEDGQAIFLNCITTGDEWCIGTEEAEFTEVNAVTLAPVNPPN